MLPDYIRLYIESFFIRVQEEIDDYSNKMLEGGFFEVPIVKRTAKRRRKTREILLNGSNNIEDSQMQEISKIFSSPGVKKIGQVKKEILIFIQAFS